MFCFRQLKYFVDIFFHRVFTCCVQVRLLSVITPSTLWFCATSKMLPFTDRDGGGGEGVERGGHNILPLLSSSY